MTQDNLITRLEAAKKGEGRLGVVATINEAIERLSPPLDTCPKHGPYATFCRACDLDTLDGEGVIQADRDRAFEWLLAKNPCSPVRDIDRTCLAEAFAAHRRAATLTPREQRMEELLGNLADAEQAYRMKHDIHGGGHSETGRAWDLLRRAGDKARSALSLQDKT